MRSAPLIIRLFPMSSLGCSSNLRSNPQLARKPQCRLIREIQIGAKGGYGLRDSPARGRTKLLSCEKKYYPPGLFKKRSLAGNYALFLLIKSFITLQIPAETRYSIPEIHARMAWAWRSLHNHIKSLPTFCHFL